MKNTELEPMLRLDQCLGKAVRQAVGEPSVPHGCNDSVMKRLALRRRHRMIWLAVLAVACVSVAVVVPYVLFANESTAEHSTLQPLTWGGVDVQEVAMGQKDDETADVKPATEQPLPVVKPAQTATPVQAVGLVQTAYTADNRVEDDEETPTRPTDDRHGEYKHPDCTMTCFIEQKGMQRTMLSRQLDCVADDGTHSTVDIYVFPFDDNREVMRWLTQVAQMLHEQAPQSQLFTLDDGQLLLEINHPSAETEMWMAEHHHGCLYIYCSSHDPQAFASQCFREFLERGRV